MVRPMGQHLRIKTLGFAQIALFVQRKSIGEGLRNLERAQASAMATAA